MKANKENDPLIMPAEPAQVSYWTRKWGITPAQLNEAILETGSLRINELRNYLRQKPFVFSLQDVMRWFRLAF